MNGLLRPIDLPPGSYPKWLSLVEQREKNLGMEIKRIYGMRVSIEQKMIEREGMRVEEQTSPSRDIFLAKIQELLIQRKDFSILVLALIRRVSVLAVNP